MSEQFVSRDMRGVLPVMDYTGIELGERGGANLPFSVWALQHGGGGVVTSEMEIDQGVGKTVM